jgi:hypothetical protein
MTTSKPTTYPARIDFVIVKATGLIKVNKLYKNHENNLVVLESKDHLDDGFDLKAAVDWCRANGYTVMEWPDLVRAWHGQPEPIRTRRQIIRERDRLQRRASSGNLAFRGETFVDLRYR